LYRYGEYATENRHTSMLPQYYGGALQVESS
jgi:hypothetical protein